LGQNRSRRSISPRPARCSADPCRPAVVTKVRSPTFSQTEKTGRGTGAAARAAKSLKCGRRPADPTAGHAARSQSEPTLSVQSVPPNSTIPWSGSIAGGRLPTLFVALGGRLVQKAIRENETLTSTPINQKSWTPADQRPWRRVFKEAQPRHFHRPAAAWPALNRNYRAHPRLVNWARQLNNSTASATK
jgi:hypothetical protein